MHKKDLLKEKCVPCKDKNLKPMEREEAQDYADEVFGWALIWNAHLPAQAGKITKEFKFRDFIGAINFVERVADIAEEEGHHPDIHIHYNKVLLELWTHAIGGLSVNDFIMAAKINTVN